MEVLFFHAAGVGDGAVNDGIVGNGDGTVVDAIADGGDGGATVGVGGVAVTNARRGLAGYNNARYDGVDSLFKRRCAMNLTDALKARQIKSEAGRDRKQVDVMRGATERLVEAGVGRSALGVGDQVPRLALPNAHGQLIVMQDLLKQGPVVLSFYRGSWCPYCTLELRAYQQSLAEIKSHGARLVAVSPELPDSSLSNAEKLALEFEVLSDVGNKVARRFGV